MRRERAEILRCAANDVTVEPRRSAIAATAAETAEVTAWLAFHSASVEMRTVMRTVAISLFLLAACATGGFAQLPSALYTWDNIGNATPSVENWVKNFGTNTVTLDNSIPGELRIIETGGAGADVGVSDGANRIRESSTVASGGLDLTGLDFLEFDFGHSGSAPINVTFFVQASTGFNFVALGPALSITPGVNTYQVPLSSLTPAQAVYVRTVGFSAANHAAVGDVTWTLREVRSAGTPLTERTLITHDAGTPEGGLQGAIVNFDTSAVQGNNGGQNQTGLSHNASGSGSLQWTDLAGQNGAAVSWGNGTAWNNSTFNNRSTDLTGYEFMIVRMSAQQLTPGDATLSVTAFFQKNNFSFQAAQGGVPELLPTDGAFHDLVFSLTGLTNMEVVDLTGINLANHSGNLLINVDSINFIPEPSAMALLAACGLGFGLRRNRHGRL